MNVSEPGTFSGSGMWINGSGPFKQSFELKIKGDLIPEAAAEEIIGELQALFARHNAGAALSAKAVFRPTKEFHTDRAEVTAFSFQTSGLSFFFHGASRGEREDEAREGRGRTSKSSKPSTATRASP
jgi:hypothetical protein